MSSHTSSAIPQILRQVLDDYGARIQIHGESTILTSDSGVASAIAQATKDVRTPYGPKITVVSRPGQQAGDADVSAVEGGNCTVQPVEQLQMDHFTHAVFGVQSEDPKFVLQGLKHMIYALRPKGVAIVVNVKVETKQVEGEGKYEVALEDKIKFQSKGKIETLSDVLYHAGFERGKIRSFEKSAVVEGGEKVEAEVVLAMKWDQLNA